MDGRVNKPDELGDAEETKRKGKVEQQGIHKKRRESVMKRRWNSQGP